MRIIGVVLARMGSTRLPGKAMLPILGRSMTWWVYTRLRWAQLLDDVVLAFPASDTPLLDFAEQFQIPYYAGSYEDLIDRLYSAALAFGADAVVRVTGDCPMVDPDIVDMMAATYLARQGEVDCVVNTWPPTFPAGLGLSVYSIKLLQELWQEIKDPVYREWFATYVKLHRDRFRVRCLSYLGRALGDLRWTVDYPEDLEFVRCIYDRLGGDFRMRDVLALLKREPELAQINARGIDRYHNFPYRRKLNEHGNPT